MKKFITFLIFCTTIIGFSQTSTGIKLIEIKNPAAININNKITENNSNSSSPNGKITFSISGGNKISPGNPYTITWANPLPSNAPISIDTNGNVTVSNLPKGTYNATIKDATCTVGVDVSFIIYDKLNVSAVQSNIKCFGGNNGSITLAITGGSGSKTINWKDIPITGPARTGLQAGTYEYTITDEKATGNIENDKKNGLRLENSIEIIGPTQSLNVSLTKIKQPSPGNNNGSLQVTVSGGYGDYSYSWKKDEQLMNPQPTLQQIDKILSLGDGKYQVTVTDKGQCTVHSNVIALKALNVKIATPQPISCQGGTTNLTAEASGGEGTINYAWYKLIGNQVVGNKLSISNSLNNINAGSYKVIVTDSKDNETSATINLPESSNPIITANTATTNVTCSDGSDGSASIAITNYNSNKTYSFKWYKKTEPLVELKNNSITEPSKSTLSGLAEGAYVVNVTDGFCDASFDVTIYSASLIVVKEELGSFKNLKCYGDANGSIKISVVGGLEPYTIKWKKDNTYITVNNDLNPTNLSAGNYSVAVFTSYDPNKLSNCSKGIENIIISAPNELNFTSTKTEVSCKNSNDGTIQLNINGGTFKTDSNNKPIYTISCEPIVSSPKPLIDIPNQKITGLKAGTWKISVSDDNNCTINEQEIEIKEPNDPFGFNPEVITNASGNSLSNGSISLKNIGGWGNYSYQWYEGSTVDNSKLLTSETTNLIKDKPAGKYTLVATDKNSDGVGCSLAPVTFEIKEPTILKLDVVATNTQCNAELGSITAVATGGAEIAQQQEERIYTYELFHNNVSKQTIVGNTANFTGLEVGQYKVVAKDSKQNVSTDSTTKYKNGSIETIGYTELTQPKPIVITEEKVSGVKKLLNCYGDTDGILSVTVSGGTPFTTGAPYTYIWKKYNNATAIYEPIGTNAPKQSNLLVGKYAIEVRDANYDPIKPSSCVAVLDNLLIDEPKKLAFTPIPTPASCFGGANGSIQLTITGGTQSTDPNHPFTITCGGGTIDAKNRIISGLAKGSYIVQVTDANGCQTAQQTIEISAPEKALHIVSEVSTPTTGFGLATGKIEISVDGGTPTYNYVWKNSTGTTIGTNSPMLSNIAAGEYSVVITDAKGCELPKTFTVLQPTKPIVSETHLQAKCHGLTGSLEASATGGATFAQSQSEKTYTFRLKNKATGNTKSITGNTATFTTIADGDYELTATDVAGIVSNTIVVVFKQPSPIVVSLASTTNVSCFGGQDGAIAIEVTGGSPFLINSVPSYTYQWQKKNTTTNSYENFTPTSLTTLTEGVYGVIVRDANYDPNNANYCVGLLDNIVITQPEDFGFDIDKINYSNPTAANGNDGTLHFEIKGGKKNYEYQLFTKNTIGAITIVKTVSNSSSKMVDFTGLKKDHYYASVKDDTGCTKYTDFDFTDNPLTSSITQTQVVSCFEANDGQLQATVNGGFGTKTIAWYRDGILLANEHGTSLMNVKKGSYYAVVKDSKMVEVTSNTITVTHPNLVTFTSTQEPVKCLGDSNGSTTLKALGGNGSYRYRYFFKSTLVKDWTAFSNGSSTTLTDLAAGNYIVQVQDTKACQSTDASITISAPTALMISSTKSVPASGFGLANGSITVEATGGNGSYIYQWFKNGSATPIANTATANNLAAGKYFVLITDAKECSLTSPLIEVTEPLLLVASAVVQNIILCNGDSNGSLRPITSGGFLKPGENYTYQWFADGNATPLATSTILSNIGKGSYYVIATDSNGNKATSKSIILTEPEILNNTLSADYTLCGDANDWTITTAPTGGTPTYNYSWNTGATTSSLQNVPPGKYSVVITDKNGCNTTKEITITAPLHLAATAQVNKPTCYAGTDASIVLTTIGGKAPYTFLWSTGEKSSQLSNAKAGNYSVTITDAKGCIIKEEYTIENPPKDVISLGEDVTLCIDQTLTINATINDDKATYFWQSDKGFTSNKPIVTLKEPANYTLTVTNKLGCQASDTITISSQNTPISAEFVLSSQVFTNEVFTIIDISNPRPDSIEWILPAEAIVKTKNKNLAEISFPKTGEYEISMASKKGNCSASQTKKVLVVNGEYKDPDNTDAIKNFDLKIYPNPSTGIFTVDVTLDKVMPASIKIFSLINNSIIASKSENGKQAYLFDFGLSGLAPGVYFILFESQQGSKLRKIIIQ
ncbi:T9SS type A sorting domain-containing protein [Flavobacterium sp.]|uniref:T9SS type A sorting domain-containing protein n=1 Tax=Flavobacterium sp. TaxID=239 RepID=UPI0026140543|nr:T9SS type A sorting domain-containing protein [Flavobacterium sp.]